MRRQGAVLKLCAEVSELALPLEAAEHLLAGCGRLLGAAFGSLVWAREAPGHYEPGTGLLVGADEATGRQIEAWFYGTRQYVQDPLNREARARRLVRGAFRRQELVEDRAWYTVDHVDGRRQLGVDDALTYTHEVPGGNVFLSLHRPWGDPLFTAEDQELLALTGRCHAWLFRSLVERSLLGPAGPALAPRLEKVLAELLTGKCESEIAESLGLSRRTAHKYVEMTYRQLGVCTRAELMALYILRPAHRIHNVGLKLLRKVAD